MVVTVPVEITRLAFYLHCGVLWYQLYINHQATLTTTVVPDNSLTHYPNGSKNYQ